MMHEDPFCLSLWDGLAYATAANLPHVYVGPAGANIAATEVVLSNTDPNPSACEVALLFHRGTGPAPPVRFNGRLADPNLFHATISREGAAIVTLTAPGAQELLTGAVYVYARSPCTASSLQVQGRTLIEQADGTIGELFSLASQSPRDWLGDGDCRVLTGVFGNGRNLGLAAVTARPGGGAPPGRAPGSVSGRSMRGAGSSASLRGWPLAGLRISTGPGSSASPGSSRCAWRRRGPATSGPPSCRSGRSPAEARCNTPRKASWTLSGWERRPPGVWRGLEEGIRQGSGPKATTQLPSPLLPVNGPPYGRHPVKPF